MTSFPVRACCNATAAEVGVRRRRRVLSVDAARHSLTLSVPTMIGPLPSAVVVEGKGEERSTEKAAVGASACVDSGRRDPMTDAKDKIDHITRGDGAARGLHSLETVQATVSEHAAATNGVRHRLIEMVLPGGQEAECREILFRAPRIQGSRECWANTSGLPRRDVCCRLPMVSMVAIRVGSGEHGGVGSPVGSAPRPHAGVGVRRQSPSNPSEA